MDPKGIGLTPELHDYLVTHGAPLDDVQQALIERTSRLGDVARMQIAPEQAAFMTLLVRLLQVRFAVEVGTFTGYSALAVARGLAPGGRLLCCDVSEEWTAIAREHWERAGVADRIDLRLAPALETLRSLGEMPPVDFAFIDADKGNYIGYYEAIVPRLAPRGVILVDNVLWGGSVVEPDADGDDVVAIRRFNDHVVADPRVDQVMLPIADGLTMITRRA
ncbi:MAG TPA: O-methyltransferase [Acidimicrobiales bacterium]